MRDTEFECMEHSWRQNTLVCPFCMNEVLQEDIHKLRAELKQCYDALSTIDCEVRTAQLDMGGKHKYSISHTGQQRIGEAIQRIK